MVKKQRTRGATQRIHFTEGRIASLRATEKTVKVYDTQVQHLGLKLLPNGRKVYFWWRAVAGKATWKTIGDSPEIQLGDARSKAQSYDILLANWKKDACAGKNPFKLQTRGAVPTFRQLVESYIANHLREESLNPVRAERDTRLMVKKRFGSWLDRPIDEITVADVLAVKAACGKGKYAVRAHVQFISTLFNWAAGKRDGKINFWDVANPAKDISVPKKERRKRFLQPEEMVRFNEELEKEKHKVLRDVLTLLLATGARKSNVYAMRWADVSFELKRWHVPMSKSGEGYEVQLSPAALKVLESRHREAGTETFVFPARSKSGHLADVKKNWREFRKRCGFPDVRLHDLRRTRGSYLAISGVSLQQIGAVLGHKSLGSTEVYAQLHSEATAKALATGDRTMKKMMQQAEKRIEAHALLTSEASRD
jgi:integrase